MDAAYTRLKKYHFTPISTGGPQTLPASTGGVKAFKFRDPDGHPLEFIWFPEGQGRAVWHQKSADTLFLGIDHSAIGISSTPQSLAFYQKLGFKAAYNSLNVGPTQQNLDGTWNAIVQITGIRPSGESGPGIEFLDYRTPPTGLPTPVDMESNDIPHVHLTIKVDDITALEKELFEARVPEISPGVVTSDFTDGRKSLLIRDPNGHALLLVE
jgi:catechol 2,3-dioxygenase-like lactoylglutathione lyase family enzyme